ncbi:MAG: formate C-acetyltransferase/glycerol dehydratase family glycyl radical enzyme, partial [Phycisphaerae bacterium]|nr:formate C-acetyltransferase/glycerol dehydratase family glycyl radical enzyme [Phycisphaerae bacterium]
ALGGLVHNIRFSSKAFETPADRQAVRSVIETYLRRGGFEIQLNIVSAETLRDAKERPEEYRDLVVRVAGYSDYFNTLTPELQDEIIARTEFSQA